MLAGVDVSALTADASNLTNYTLQNGVRSANVHGTETIQKECLDRFVIFGESHMDHVCKEYLEYYHTERPHQGQGIENELLITKRMATPVDAIPLDEVRCSERLGGLLKSYSRKAA